ncbi:MAG: hypothetical protein J7K49_03800 [Thaumarchaeota archaeon]|nr:hypothetical protein [Nitrososphaerota archaeon]
MEKNKTRNFYGTIKELLKSQNSQTKNFGKEIIERAGNIVQTGTGEIKTDVNDASGTSFFDVKKRQWSYEIISNSD